MKHYVYVLMNEYGIVEYVGQTNNTNTRMRNHMGKQTYTNTGIVHNGKFNGRTDLTIEVVKEFDKRKDALNYEGELKMQLGFEWTEKTGRSKAGKITSDNGFLALQRELQKQKISAYCKYTQNHMGTYSSQSECAKELGLQQGMISECLLGKRKSTKGYTFKRETK